MGKLTKCQKCLVEQDPDHPMCIHMAGKKGGNKVKQRYGRAHYERIGKMGGNTVKDLIKKGECRSYEEIGKLGGQAIKKKAEGTDFFEEIGKKGGQKVARERGRPFYEEIGSKGGAKVKELLAKGRAVESEEKARPSNPNSEYDCPTCGQSRNGYENHHCPPSPKKMTCEHGVDTLDPCLKCVERMALGLNPAEPTPPPGPHEPPEPDDDLDQPWPKDVTDERE